MLLFLRDWLDLSLKIYMYIHVYAYILMYMYMHVMCTWVACLYMHSLYIYFRCDNIIFFRGDVMELRKEHKAKKGPCASPPC